MNEETKLRISKLDAAHRQLDCAISLWSTDEDEVSIHTLVGAAHEVLSNLHEKKGLRHPIFDTDLIKDEYKQKYRKLLRKEINFFKHADTDPDGVIDFSPFLSVFFIVASISILYDLGQTPTDTQKAFQTWVVWHLPSWINAKHLQFLSEIPAHLADDLRKLDKEEFFELCLRQLAKIRTENGR